MVVNVSIQYNGGFLPDIIMLTLRDYIADPFDTTKSYCSYSQSSHLNLLVYLDVLFFLQKIGCTYMYVW